MAYQLDSVFGALADPTRRAIVARLAAGESQVSELSAPFRISAPAVSKHLKVLEQAGLISRRVDAQRRIISLNPEALKLASLWVDQYRSFWEGSLDRLETLLAEEPGTKTEKHEKDSKNEQANKTRRRSR